MSLLSRLGTLLLIFWGLFGGGPSNQGNVNRISSFLCQSYDFLLDVGVPIVPYHKQGRI